MVSSSSSNRATSGAAGMLGTAGNIAAPTPPSTAVCKKRRRGATLSETTLFSLDKLPSLYGETKYAKTEAEL